MYSTNKLVQVSPKYIYPFKKYLLRVHTEPDTIADEKFMMMSPNTQGKVPVIEPTIQCKSTCYYCTILVRKRLEATQCPPLGSGS